MIKLKKEVDYKAQYNDMLLVSVLTSFSGLFFVLTLNSVAKYVFMFFSIAIIIIFVISMVRDTKVKNGKKE